MDPASRPVPRIVPCALLAVGLALPGAASSAEERRLQLHPDRTEISFLLDAALHKVHGTAHLATGTILFDPATGVASGEVIIDARSLDTEKPRRDRKMHERVLESERYPEIRLVPSRLDGILAAVGRSEVTLHGEILLHGASHPVSLASRLDVDGETVELSTRFTVPYVAWGLDDPSTFLLRVGKEVEITIRATARLDAALR